MRTFSGTGRSVSGSRLDLQTNTVGVGPPLGGASGECVGAFGATPFAAHDRGDIRRYDSCLGLGMTTPSPTPDVAHDWLDDAHALIAGSLFIALGLTMFAHAGLLTGGVAGLAFLFRYLGGPGLGFYFFVLNLPFCWLAWKHLGLEFTVKTFVSIAMVSAFTTLAPRVLQIEILNPWFAAVLGGMLIGFGILFLLRHRSSIGGISVVAQWLQQTRGHSAGKIQMALDICIVLAALTLVPPVRVLQSVLGAVVVSAILVLNHRPGRYLGV